MSPCAGCNTCAALRDLRSTPYPAQLLRPLRYLCAALIGCCVHNTRRGCMLLSSFLLLRSCLPTTISLHLPLVYYQPHHLVVNLEPHTELISHFSLLILYRLQTMHKQHKEELSYTPAQLESAYKAVIEGQQSVHKSAAKFQVPFHVLCDKVEQSDFPFVR